MANRDDPIGDYIFCGADCLELMNKKHKLTVYSNGDNAVSSRLPLAWSGIIEGDFRQLVPQEAIQVKFDAQRFKLKNKSNLANHPLRVGEAAEMEFQRLKRAYYGYWISKINCPLKGWKANSGVKLFKIKGCYGCLECQARTYYLLINIVPPIQLWNIDPVRIPGHSAVAVYEKGGDLKEGYIFDPWYEQKPVIYKFDDWPPKTKNNAHVVKL